MKYKYIVFDIDGTLIDTEYAVLHSLQKTLQMMGNQKKDIKDLRFVLGITGKDALNQLEIEDVEHTLRLWNQNMKYFSDTIQAFEGIREMLRALQKEHIKMGIVTSKSRAEYEGEFVPFGFTDFFEFTVCAEDTKLHKPNPDPILKYLSWADADKSEVLYIGDSIYDMECAKQAGIDCGLALWGCQTVRHIQADYYFNRPEEIPYLFHQQELVPEKAPWLKWAMELQFIAQAGITYTKDCFDLERFERIREISAEMLSMKSGISLETVKDLFCNETGFQTPKLDTRAAIFQEDKILLVQEKSGKWALPGGWVDVNQSVKSNTIKEAKEESGLDVIPVRLIAVQDRNKHNLPLYAYGICKVFVLCEVIGGEFQKNIETVSSGYFSLNELPSLSEDKNTLEQIEMCFQANRDTHWVPFFD